MMHVGQEQTTQKRTDILQHTDDILNVNHAKSKMTIRTGLHIES